MGNNVTRLFEGGIFEVRDALVAQAVEDVKRLPDPVLLDPSLAGTLQKIAANYGVPSATLEPERRSGTRRTERRLTEQFGERVEVDVTFIDVDIPFTGSPQAFDIAPSRSEVIYDRVQVGRNSIIATFPDDASLEKSVNTLIARITTNLDTLREESKGLSREILDTIRRVADQRIAQIRAQNERDQTRSFPIR